MRTILLIALLATPVFATSPDDPRAADRAAIRAHIDKIFKAYIDGDCATIRATHAPNWIGFTSQSKSIMRGIDEYMKGSAPFCADDRPRSPQVIAQWALADYKIVEIDYLFYGDVALVPYVADTWYGREARVPGKLRSLDVYAKAGREWNQVGSNIYPHPDAVQAQFERMQQARRLSPQEEKKLMTDREAVWRAYFAGDLAQLEKLLPEETLVIDNVATGEKIASRKSVLEDARQFAGSGAKLVRLEFPETKSQVYGNTAVLYTTYTFELQQPNGSRDTHSGRATEIFVLRNGRWLNSGWHLQPDK